MLMSVHLPDSEASQLLAGEGELSHLSTSGSELLGQLPMQPHLFGEAVRSILLAMKEKGLLSAMSHKGLQRGHELETQKGKMKVKSMDVSHLASRCNDVTQ